MCYKGLVNLFLTMKNKARVPHSIAFSLSVIVPVTDYLRTLAGHNSTDPELDSNIGRVCFLRNNGCML